MRPSGYSDFLKLQLVDLLPLAHSYSEDARRESVQTSIWLVGLASGLLSLATALPKAMMVLSRGSLRTLVGCLAATVVLGLLHRILNQLADQRMRTHFLGIRAYLTGATWSHPFLQPLQNWWTVEEIVKRFAEDFELDYSFLVHGSATLQFAQDCYRSCFDGWARIEEDAREKLVDLLEAYVEPAQRRGQLRGIISSSALSDLASVRSETEVLHRLERAIRGLSITAIGTFVIAISLVCAALLISVGV